MAFAFRLLLLSLLGFFLSAGVSCGGATADRGYDLRLRVAEAQLVRAPFPEDRGGPKLTLVDLRDTQVGAGDTDNPIYGRASGDTFAIHVGLEGDPGYWLSPVGLPDDVNPGELQFSVLISYARNLPPGPIRVLLQAVNAEGTPGPVSVARLEILDPTPQSPLVFSLIWDQNVDADLLVQDPTGITVGPKNISTREPPPPGSPLPPAGEALTGGLLDQDSNANCVLDGRRRENVYWASKPPSGRYRVYAAMASTCGLDHASFRVEIRYGGRLYAFADVLYASDGRSNPVDPPLSPGLLVTEFDVP